MSTVPEGRFGGVELPQSFIFGRHCPATDPIAMEYAIEEGDPAIRTQLVVLRMETLAKIYSTLAESAAQAARIHAEGGAG